MRVKEDHLVSQVKEDLLEGMDHQVPEVKMDH